MTRKLEFSVNSFLIMLGIALGLAGLISWLSGMSFWILLTIAVAAILANGLLATVEDGDKPKDD